MVRIPPSGPRPLHVGVPDRAICGPAANRDGLDHRSVRRRGSWTTTAKTVLANSPYRDDKLDRSRHSGRQSRPARPGDPSPIQHVIYIVKENRTYDQVLGDMKEGNGDPSLSLFGEKVTPNHHKLAREFVLFDNFYVNADVSADGHNWSTAAIAPDYVQKMWPNSYAGRRKHVRLRRAGSRRPAPGRVPLDQRRCRRASRMRNYGYMVNERCRTPPRRDRADRRACATRCSRRSPTELPRRSTWSTPMSTAPRSSSAISRNSRRPAACRG